MKTLKISAVLGVALALMACTPKESQSVQTSAPKTAPAEETMLAGQKFAGVWIDVRTPQEYAQGHLQGSQNVPVDEIGAKISAISPDKNAPINLYCRSGRRAQVALETLKNMGYTNVTNHGGYEELQKQGLR